MDDLPPELVQRMVAADGRVRIQVFPRTTLMDTELLEEFIASVREIDPRVVGVAVNMIRFGRAIEASFQTALITAVVAISILLLLLWRNLFDTLLVLVPLLLSATLTVAWVSVVGLAFNYANVIVIPLLLGIGVDSGIHLVHRSKNLISGDEDLLGTTTARAVFYSALTTTVSFGSLAFSSHRGMQGMGIVLSMGMLLTVVCNLIVLPALIDLRKPEPVAQ